MSLEVVPYTPAHDALWDGLCERAVNATFLHTRRFLGYHGERFQDESLLFMDGARLAGVMPAARARDDARRVVSHPGATYGGIVHDGWLSGARMVEALRAAASHYTAAGFAEFDYKPVPHIYAMRPAQDDVYALFAMDAVRVQCGLSSTVDLANEAARHEQRRRGLQKARKAVALSTDSVLADAVWDVLAGNLASRHDAAPVHTKAELRLLMSLFPAQITVVAGLLDAKVEAGLILFHSPNVWHAQYIAASEKAHAVSALDAVFDEAIRLARAAGARYFDFGISTEDGGRVLNEGLYRFKAGFGGGGVACDSYRLALPVRSPVRP